LLQRLSSLCRDFHEIPGAFSMVNIVPVASLDAAASGGATSNWHTPRRLG
jgi:hypothetical protein